MLNKWGLLVKRAELLKHTYGAHPRNHSYSPGGAALSYFPPPHRGVTFSVICASCDQGLKDSFFCSNCKTFGFKCAICNLSVKGLSNFCILCGHGGHAHHMAMWFKRESYCPAGCNCECVFRDEPTLRSQKSVPYVHEPSPSSPSSADKDINDASTYSQPNTSVTHGEHSHGLDERTDYSHDPILSHDPGVTSHELSTESEETLLAAYQEGFHPDSDHHDSPDLLDAPLTFDDPLPAHPSFFSEHLPAHSLFPNLPSGSRSSPVSNASDEFY